jgi:hypothetical protein
MMRHAITSGFHSNTMGVRLTRAEPNGIIAVLIG